MRVVLLDQVEVRVRLLEDGGHAVLLPPLGRILPPLLGLRAVTLLGVEEAVRHWRRLAVHPRIWIH